MWYEVSICTLVLALLALGVALGQPLDHNLFQRGSICRTPAPEHSAYHKRVDKYWLWVRNKIQVKCLAWCKCLNISYYCLLNKWTVGRAQIAPFCFNIYIFLLVYFSFLFHVSHLDTNFYFFKLNLLKGGDQYERVIVLPFYISVR